MMAEPVPGNKNLKSSKFKGIPQQQFIASILMILVGGGLLIFQIITGPLQAQRTSSFVAAEGKVIDYVESINHQTDNNASTRILFSEVVEYQVKDQTYRIVATSAKTNPKAIGSVVPVKYNPGNPQDAILPALVAETRIVFYIFGGIFLALGLFLLISPFFGLQLRR